MIDYVSRFLLVGVCVFWMVSIGCVKALTLKELMAVPQERSLKPDLSAQNDLVHQGRDKVITPFVSNRFSSKAVERKIQQELQEKYGDNIEIHFASWALPGSKTRNVKHFIIEEIEVNPQKTNLTALVHFDIGGHVKSLRLRGRLDHLIEVPTLNRPIHYGELITKEDITWTKISGHKSTRFLITNPQDLVGRQPRAGFLKVRSPLYQRDIELVRDIEKGSVVTAHYKTAKLELLTKVRALEHGHKGQNIRILNPDTNKILYGAVVGPGHVSLSPVPLMNH